MRGLRSSLQTQSAGDFSADGASLAPEFNALRESLHTKLMEQIDFGVMNRMAPERFREEIGRLLERMLDDTGAAINTRERRLIIQAVQDEVMGLGPLEPLLADPTISDILINGASQVYIERGGRLSLTDVSFADDAHLMKIIDKIVSRVGRRVDESSPMVDARLPDGSRVNAIIPPLALDGPVMSIRRFGAKPLGMEDLINRKAFPPVLAALLRGIVGSKLNVLISGGTGTGKTTMLNVLSSAIPHSERIVTIEDAAELQMQQPHVVRLETRPPNIEGKGEVNQRALVRNALRMRPDRIILGEVRGAEVLDMLQAMNTGHEGSMATVHANSPRDALARLETMIGYAGVGLTQEAMRQQVSSAIQVVVQLSRLNDGQRKLVSLQEIVGMEGDIVTMQEIFRFKQTGIGPNGEVQGHFSASGIRPKFMSRLQAFGMDIRDDMFNPGLTFE